MSWIHVFTSRDELLQVASTRPRGNSSSRIFQYLSSNCFLRIKMLLSEALIIRIRCVERIPFRCGTPGARANSDVSHGFLSWADGVFMEFEPPAKEFLAAKRLPKDYGAPVC